MPRARHIKVKLEVDKFRRAQGIRLGAHANEAVAQPPLQRAERLPFQTIERISIGMALRYRRAGELLPPVVVVTLRAGEIDLSLPLVEHIATGLQERLGALVAGHIDRHAPRLPSDIGR